MENALSLGHQIRNLLWRSIRAITIGVRVMVVKDNSLLLVWHNYKELWHLPGGGVHRGETLEQAALREVKEESGIDVERLELLSVYSDFSEGRTDHVIVFWGKVQNINEIRSWEIKEARFFKFNELPENVSDQSLAQIRLFEHRE